MNAVSTRDAIGSAVKASAAGRAILAISRPNSSNLNTDLLIAHNKLYKKTRNILLVTYEKIATFQKIKNKVS